MGRVKPNFMDRVMVVLQVRVFCWCVKEFIGCFCYMSFLSSSFVVGVSYFAEQGNWFGFDRLRKRGCRLRAGVWQA